DEIALLNRPKATVIREGKEQNIDPGEIVLGDILLVRPGDQIVVDGVVVGEGRMEVDESLLTGESDMILKFAEQPVYSGTFCVSGSACYEVQKVGAETLAYQLTIGARAFRQVLTPLQREINVVIRVFMLMSCFLWILVSISFLSRSYSLSDLLQRAAVIAGLVPAGLLLAITLAYGLGGVKMIGQNVLIQQANAVESLSNVDVLCLDKTGTLTTNQINLETIYPLDIGEEELRSLLGDYAASTKVGNRTSNAIGLACPGRVRSLFAEVPFSSSRKWSAIAFDDTLRPGIYVLGAPEVLTKNITLNPELNEYIAAETAKGLRVVLFAYSPNFEAVKTWHFAISSQPAEVELPANPIPLALLSFSDQLRPEAYETIQGFAKAGIEIKIISGDHPQTVAALAKQAGMGTDLTVVSGQELAQMSPIEFAQTAKNG
ncbi:MAG TPA: HAD-IC family P-type ATPase, partial [Phormidium sp.]